MNGPRGERTLRVLKEAIARYGKPEIVNSDQECRYTSELWAEYLKENKIRTTMDGRGLQLITSELNDSGGPLNRKIFTCIPLKMGLNFVVGYRSLSGTIIIIGHMVAWMEYSHMLLMGFLNLTLICFARLGHARGRASNRSYVEKSVLVDEKILLEIIIQLNQLDLWPQGRGRLYLLREIRECLCCTVPEKLETEIYIPVE